tara:strand:- start:1036 stop:1509 length:474 start_codon:yes stop_codon:yes gene_type:complete
MMFKMISGAAFAAAATLSLSAGAARAAGDDVFTVTTDVPFEDAAQAVHDAIINKGYKVDYHGYVGDMLKRTAEDVGAEKKLYKDAEFFTFCSAVLSRKAMEADIGDIAYCPYVVFVYEDASTPGTVTIGHRKLPAGEVRDEVNKTLDEIVNTASDGF